MIPTFYSSVICSNGTHAETENVDETMLPIKVCELKLATVKIAFVMQNMFGDEKSAKTDNLVRTESKSPYMLDMTK